MVPAVPLELTVVDAFTDRPFSGNPAAVCVLDEFPEADLMQRVAGEMNLAETAFAVHRGGDAYGLRWFTPTVEVPLCGHATLATVHVLGRPARFETLSGELVCTIASDGFIELDFPADPPEEAAPPASLDLPLEWFGRGRSYGLALLADAAAVRSLAPDMTAIAGLSEPALIVTAAGDRPGIDCVSRFFAPRLGVAEDPVTGSAHCTLCPFWAPRLGRDVLVGEQASARGGIVHMRAAGPRVVLGGRAVTTARVSLLV
jgi:predicted PhzF superfamily epimerase YddE/YHI9